MYLDLSKPSHTFKWRGFLIIVQLGTHKERYYLFMSSNTVLSEAQTMSTLTTNDTILSVDDVTAMLRIILKHRLNSSGRSLRKLQGTTEEKILSVLLGMCERGTDITLVHAHLLGKIRALIALNKPITISLSLAVGCKIPNPLKFNEFDTPTFGWLHLAWFFSLLNEKVKLIYPPGVEIVLFDEAKLFEHEMNLPNVDTFLHQVETLFRAMDAPIKIIPLTKEMIPGAANVVPVHVPDEIVYAMVCSLPEMTDTVVMDPLYARRAKDLPAARQRVGEALWQKATTIAGTVSAVLTLRKQQGLFQRLAGENLLDACITDKTERLVFDVTSPCLINHGVPVVDIDPLTGRYKLFVTPIYRVQRGDYGNPRPVIWDLGNGPAIAYFEQ